MGCGVQGILQPGVSALATGRAPVKIEGEHRFAGRREVIWGMLMDPAVIAKTVPGTTRMAEVAPGKYEGAMRVGIGAIVAADFDVAVALADVSAPAAYTMLIEGHGKFGFARGSAQVRLEPEGPDGAGTLLRYAADMVVGGKVAAVGQRLLDSISKLLSRQGLEALAREVDERLGRAR